MLHKRISSIGLFIISEMRENPTVKYAKYWFHATLLINFKSVIVLVAPYMAVLQVMEVFQI